jgi:hypothetical protein
VSQASMLCLCGRNPRCFHVDCGIRNKPLPPLPWPCSFSKSHSLLQCVSIAVLIQQNQDWDCHTAKFCYFSKTFETPRQTSFHFHGINGANGNKLTFVQTCIVVVVVANIVKSSAVAFPGKRHWDSSLHNPFCNWSTWTMFQNVLLRPGTWEQLVP